MSALAETSNLCRYSSQPLPGGEAKGRVVIVDDEPAILETWGMILNRFGYAVTCCAEGASALNAIAEGCDCVITDHNMPGMTGVELIRRARPQSKAQFILMTGHMSESIRQDAIEAGACCIVEKPTSPALVLQKLASFCR